ncbi:MAG: hypothetical protein C0511_03085 [Hyphomicrobium sp.]|nr:hypothetical protein [Hyphomicrobium sp.]PPC83319.1 MAG: hypothetical protein CTY40_02545 [Hyphomicrobium sp.]
MSSPNAARGQVVLIDHTAAHVDPGAYKGLHAIVPILVGISLPILLFSLFDPRALSSTKLVLHVLMMGIAMLAATVFLMSITNPGNVVQAVFDPGRRSVDVVRSGAFANNVLTISFDRISTVRVETVYDDDGYQNRVALLVMKNRDMIQLPTGTSEAELAEIRRILEVR